MPPPKPGGEHPETMKRSIRRISRTSHEALFTCPRKFYWGFEWQGAGLDTPLKDLKLLIGIAVHAGLEAVMKDPGMSPQGASTIARASFLEETAAHREAWTEDPRALGNLEEAELLVGALTYGWVKTQLAAFLMRFEVIHSEEELETPLSPDVVLQSRLDVLVRERSTGLIYVINWKCPSPEQPVSMADGTSKLARDVREGDWVLGSKGPLQVTAVGPGGVQPCYVLHTTLGRTIKASFEHPVLVRGPEGETWVPLNKLVPGDELRVWDGQEQGRDFVKSVEQVGAGETVAITTSGDHTITLGGVVTHNTTDKKDPEKLRDSYKEDSQMWAEALAAEQHLGEAVEGTILVGLFKGVIRNGSYTTPLLYYYEKEGVQRVGYQAGWAKVRADQHPDGLFGWIDNLPAETLAEQFYLCDPILKHNEVVEDRLAGWVYREGKAKYVLANGSEADKLLEFGARDGYWCMWCPFRAPCKEGVPIERMVESGRLVKRVDHHGKGGGK